MINILLNMWNIEFRKWIVVIIITSVWASPIYSQKGNLNGGLSITAPIYYPLEIQISEEVRNGPFRYECRRSMEFGIHLSYYFTDRFAIGLGTRYRRLRSEVSTMILTEVSQDELLNDSRVWNSEFLALELFVSFAISAKSSLLLRLSRNDPIEFFSADVFHRRSEVLFYTELVDNSLELFSAEFNLEVMPASSSNFHSYVSLEYGYNLFSLVDIFVGVERNFFEKGTYYSLNTERSDTPYNVIEINTDYFGVYLGVRTNLTIINKNR